MKENLLYAALALIFLLAAGVALTLSSFWSGRFSAHSRALASRLKEIAVQRRQDEQSQLLKTGSGLQAIWQQWILANAPGVRALALLLTRSGSKHTAAEVMAQYGSSKLSTKAIHSDKHMASELRNA